MFGKTGEKNGPWKDPGGMHMERWKSEDPEAYKRMRKKFPKKKSTGERVIGWIKEKGSEYFGRGK